MKSIKKLLALLTLSFAAVTFSSASSNLIDEAKNSELLQSAATTFLGSINHDSDTSKTVKNLLSGISGEKANMAITALASLANKDFSKEQLKSYGGLLAAAAPAILGATFDLENGEYGQYIAKAIEFYQSGDLAHAGEAVGSAMKFFDSENDKTEVLSGLLSAAAPLLDGVDLGKAMNTGSDLLKKGNAAKDLF